MLENRSADRILMGKPEVKIPLQRHRLSWEDNIKMDLQVTCWGRGLDLYESE
jgi:hypothetical protein